MTQNIGIFGIGKLDNTLLDDVYPQQGLLHQGAVFGFRLAQGIIGLVELDSPRRDAFLQLFVNFLQGLLNLLAFPNLVF